MAGAERVKWPENLVRATLCAVADTLGFSKAKRDLLQELVRRGYLAMHGGRQTYMLTTTGLQKALEECLPEPSRRCVL